LYNNKYPLPSSRFINHSQYQKNSKKCYWVTSTLILKNLKFPKVDQVFSNFKKRVLNPAYKELKEKGDYYFEYELIKTGKKVISLNFQILKNGEGEKIRKDFHKKKKLFIY